MEVTGHEDEAPAVSMILQLFTNDEEHIVG
jgi:hypothetical protein